MVLGQVDGSSGAVRYVYGHNRKTLLKNGIDGHAKAGMLESAENPVFRYLLDDGFCYWWREQGEVNRSCAEFAMERIGYKVKGHKLMMRCNPDMRTAHGWE